MRIPFFLTIFLTGHFFLSAAELQATTFPFDFKDGSQGWVAGFADYPVEGDRSIYALKQGIRRLPADFPHRNKAYFISGANRSDDLCMYLSRQVGGLSPNTNYSVTFTVTFASNASRSDTGVGGPPGSGVTIKAGATLQSPGLTVERGYFRLTIDKGNQAKAGRDALDLGNVGVRTSGSHYHLKTLKNSERPFVFTTDSTGSAWLFICSDSGFEATTSLYYTRVVAQFQPRS